MTVSNDKTKPLGMDMSVWDHELYSFLIEMGKINAYFQKLRIKKMQNRGTLSGPSGPSGQGGGQGGGYGSVVVVGGGRGGSGGGRGNAKKGRQNQDNDDFSDEEDELHD